MAKQERMLSLRGHASSSAAPTLWSFMTEDERRQYLGLFDAIVRGEQFAEWFWSRCERQGDGCWLWSSTTTKRGYGVVSLYPFGQSPTHRVAYQIAHGPIPEGKVVLHRCDNRACVNPAHLSAGIQHENIQDRIAKGRSVYAHGARHGSHTQPERTPRGESHSMAKFTDADILEMRRLFDRGEATVTELSRRFPTSTSNISNIVKRRR